MYTKILNSILNSLSLHGFHGHICLHTTTGQPKIQCLLQNSLHAAICTGDVMLKVDDNFLDINECMYQPIYCLVSSQTSEVFEMWSLKCEVHDM